jgi:uncharacterized membrane protein YbaN (DUF454 family)
VSRLRRYIYIALGLLLTGVGIAGIFIPLLPTTVFFLIAAWLFSRTSPALHNWLKSNKVTGPFLKAYTSGQPISRRHQVTTTVILWLTLLTSAWFVRDRWWVLAILGAVGIGVTWHLVALGKGRGEGN